MASLTILARQFVGNEVLEALDGEGLIKELSRRAAGVTDATVTNSYQCA